MILTEKEQVIVNNMIHTPIRNITTNESCETLSDDELIVLINKIDQYRDEVGKIQKAFANYDEFYVLELISVKSRLIKAYRSRHIKI